MNGKGWIIGVALVVGIIGAAVVFGKDNSGTIANSEGSQNYYGNAESPVTVTEFVDFQCEACYAYYPGVKEVKEEYKDRVQFRVRNFPIVSGHQFAMQAARSAEAAARQGKFWEMHDKIFEGQKIWERTQNPQSYFDQYAEEIGLDMEKYNSDRESGDVAAVINKDLADVKEIGGSGTPTFAINGEKVENPGPSVEALSKMIDDALAEAESN
jgi:protein-disulfide isomerase